MTEREELEARAAKARAELAEIESGREERAELAALKRRVTREENAVRDAPHVIAAEEKYGEDKLAILETVLGKIILKRPNHLHHQKFANVGKVTTENSWTYVKACIVYPDAKTVEAWCEEIPGVPLELAALALELARGGAREVEKK